eukprot:TRINITY_DN11850_c0_g1_i1.p1 TRINITY_DN11850_c0_g1~~TRINITY_DN11850_c0_g1_i1.p1  ORF type:complete len:579 (+),score=149.12 TRINITY_DN11850_c0_g1_i1:69-1739(+)
MDAAFWSASELRLQWSELGRLLRTVAADVGTAAVLAAAVLRSTEALKRRVAEGRALDVAVSAQRTASGLRPSGRAVAADVSEVDSARCAAALRSDWICLSRLLQAIEAGVARARELAASVQHLVECWSMAAVLHQEEMLSGMLESAERAACMLRINLLLEPAGRKIAVDLPHDGTVLDLLTAARQAGGPPHFLQEVSVGGAPLTHTWDTLLSRAGLAAGSLCVVRRDARSRRVSVGLHYGLAVLDGRVGCWGSLEPALGASDLRPGFVTSVHAAMGFTAAIAGGRLALSGARVPAKWEQLECEPVCCSVSRPPLGTTRPADICLCVVDRSGTLSAWDVQGRRLGVPSLDVVAAAAECTHVVALTRSGAVCRLVWEEISSRARLKVREWADLGGMNAVSVSSGCVHFAALLEDGTVRCFGQNSFGQCDVPAGLAGVVSVDCGAYHTVALRADGTICCWGEGSPEDGSFLTLSNCVAVAAGYDCTVAVVEERGGYRVVASGGDETGRFGLHPLPPGGLRQTRVVLEVERLERLKRLADAESAGRGPVRLPPGWGRFRR